jgi:NitT/TauT family transport system substrate-binding protein
MHLHNWSPHSLFVLESSGIKAFKDLPGKTLATTPGNSHRNYFPITARMAGIDPDSVEWTTVDSATMPSLLVGKKVDAVPYWTDNAAFVRPQVEAMGDKLVIIPFADYGFRIYSSCFFARLDVMQNNPDLVRRFIKAAQRSIIWGRDNAEEAARLHKERWPDTKISANLNGWLDLRNYIFGKNNEIKWTGHYDPEKVKKTYEIVAESLKLPSKFDTSKFFDNSFLPPK